MLLWWVMMSVFSVSYCSCELYGHDRLPRYDTHDISTHLEENSRILYRLANHFNLKSEKRSGKKVVITKIPNKKTKGAFETHDISIHMEKNSRILQLLANYFNLKSEKRSGKQVVKKKIPNKKAKGAYARRLVWEGCINQMIYTKNYKQWIKLFVTMFD